VATQPRLNGRLDGSLIEPLVWLCRAAGRVAWPISG
jgi:hypothetical protein